MRASVCILGLRIAKYAYYPRYDFSDTRVRVECIQILWYPCVCSCLRYCALRHRSFIDHTELEENFRNAISELFIPNER